MVRCFHCKNYIIDESKMIVEAPDGDCFCDKNCYENYKKNRKYFFDSIVDSEEKTLRWLKGEDV